MYYPFNYDTINAVEGSYSPSMVKNNSYAFRYWQRSLFQRACSTLDFELPDTWTGKTRDFFYYCMFRFGFVAIFERQDFGRVFNPCTISGRDFYYQPTNVIVTNPSLDRSLDLSIGTDCELLKLTPDYMGVWDIIAYYAEKLATLDGAINMSLINNKLAYIVAARNKTAAEALKKIMDKVNAGEPTVVYDKKLLLPNDADDKDTPFQTWERQDLKASYITTEQLQDFQTILNNFDTEIGIPVLPYAKKERMVTSEAESRMIDSTSRCKVWVETIRSSIDEVKKLYPDIRLGVKALFEKIDEEKEDAEDGNDDTDRNL